MSKTPRITKLRARILRYLESNPGASCADVDRACRTARGGHRWIYAAVDRMIKAGLVKTCEARPSSKRGGAIGLVATSTR